MEIDEDSIKVKAFCDLTKPRADKFFFFYYVLILLKYGTQ